MTQPNPLEKIESELKQSIGEHFPHCQFLAAFLVALVAVCKVTLGQIADALPGSAKTESKFARLRYFLTHAALPEEAFARAIAPLIPAPKPLDDCLGDCFGSNGLEVGQDQSQPARFVGVLQSVCYSRCATSVCYKGCAFPMLWMALPEGASNTKHRIASHRIASR